jgi:hypothetical protein
MRPADVDRVDLDEAVVGEGSGEVGRGGIEQQRPADEAAGVVGGEAQRWNHGGTVARKSPRGKRGTAGPTNYPGATGPGVAPVNREQ